MATNEIVYENYHFVGEDIKSGNLYLATSLRFSTLEVNTFCAVVACDDPQITDFIRNTPMYYDSGDGRRCVFYVQKIRRVKSDRYEISATSAIGRLGEGKHYGGIYTGQTVEAVLPGICMGVPYTIKSNMRGIKLYGWLPIAAPRDNLRQLLIAIGAVVKTDLDGVIHIEGLWDGVSSEVAPERMYRNGAGVRHDSKVSQVTVVEHQYIKGTESKQLFEGTAQAGDIITFSEPMHSLSAAGFSILEQGANYAKVSAGTGTLTGCVYIHNTRQISENVATAPEPNVKTVANATLISLVNSRDVAKRMANYYQWCEVIDAPVVYQGENPGDRVMAFHPFDGVSVPACLESADITLSNTLKAQEKMLVGFVPSKIGGGSYESVRKVIQASGSFTVPDGVTSIRAVLIGSGQSGSPGSNGEDGQKGTKFTYSNPDFGITTYWATLGYAGKGGKGGSGGVGGKVLQVDIDVTPGDVIQVGIGKNGGATTFGVYSSDSGSIPPAGYTDIVTGEVFAQSGDVGFDGGDGNGWAGGSVNRDNARTVKNGDPVGGYTPGVNDLSQGHYMIDTEYEYIMYYHLGGGAARNVNGPNGLSGWWGAPGADATLIPSKPATMGKGGTGGSGGGGGAGGPAFQSANSKHTPNEGGAGGKGAAGGQGADGGVILYFSQLVPIKDGPVVDKNGRMLLDKHGRRFVV